MNLTCFSVLIILTAFFTHIVAAELRSHIVTTFELGQARNNSMKSLSIINCIKYIHQSLSVHIHHIFYLIITKLFNIINFQFINYFQNILLF